MSRQLTIWKNKIKLHHFSTQNKNKFTTGYNLSVKKVNESEKKYDCLSDVRRYKEGIAIEKQL